MKIIDADALIEEIQYYIDEAGWSIAHNEALNWCIEFIEHSPTVEERKTGRWEDVHIDVANDDKGRSYRFYSCTACGVTSIPAMLGMKKKWLHFCPNCGAKMEDCEE